MTDGDEFAVAAASLASCCSTRLSKDDSISGKPEFGGGGELREALFFAGWPLFRTAEGGLEALDC